MATIKSAPTPEQFARTWSKGFEEALKEAAGKDGRLSRREAEKMAERGDEFAQYADNAINYLEHTGQKSVSAKKLAQQGYKYAFAVGSKVAGKGNRISLVEARLLPDDIKGDFLTLRGKGDTKAPKLTGAKLAGAVQDIIANAYSDGMSLAHISDADCSVKFVSADNPHDKPVTGRNVMRMFQDAIDDELFDADDDFPQSRAAETLSKPETRSFFAQLSEFEDGLDDYYRETMAAFTKIKEVFNANLTDVRAVKIGEKMDDGNLDLTGVYAYFILGKTDDGQMAGIGFGSVET